MTLLVYDPDNRRQCLTIFLHSETVRRKTEQAGEKWWSRGEIHSCSTSTSTASSSSCTTSSTTHYCHQVCSLPPSLPLKQWGVSVLILYDCFLHFNNKRIPHPVWRFDPSDLVLSVPSSLNFLRRRDRAGNADRNGESHEGSNKGLLDFRTFSFWFQQQTKKKKKTNFRCTVSCKYVTRQNWHWFDWSSFRS